MARAILCAVVLTVLTARPAVAFRGYRSSIKLPVSVLITVGAEETQVGNLRFSGTPSLNGTTLATVVRSGAQLGLARPVLVDTAFHVDGDFHHVALGAMFGVLWDGRTQGPVAAPANAQGSMSGFYVGPEAATVWSRKWFDFRAGFALGYRRYSFPLVGFDSVPCGRGSRCQPSISSESFFFRPSVTMGGHYKGVSFGAYGGGDVVTGGGWSAGTYVGVENQLWRERAAIVRD